MSEPAASPGPALPPGHDKPGATMADESPGPATLPGYSEMRLSISAAEMKQTWGADSMAVQPDPKAAAT